MTFTRRDLIKLGAGAGAALAVGPARLGAWSVAGQDAVITKPSPSSGEEIPIVGIGTRDYNTRASDEEMGNFRESLRLLIENGGRVIDTAEGYGRGTSETVLGRLVEELGHTDTVFWATKVAQETRDEGIAAMEDSFRQLRTDVIDLMQVHNLRGATTQLATIRAWKDEGRIRYSGITTSSARQYDEMARLIETEEMDFVQIDYSLGNREAADRILPMCRERGIATLINLPYGRESLFRAVGDRPLPDFAAEWCDSWGQFFLKYVVSHPAVTCAIPGTTTPRHAPDNMGAARGWLPDAAMRTRMEAWFDAL